MGGNALTVNKGIRLEAPQYMELRDRCVALLRGRYPGSRVHAIEAYRSKPNYGDLDLLVESIDYDPHQAAAALDAVEVVRNGPVTSVGVIVRPEVPHRDDNVFQVDLIKTGPETFDYAAAYFSFNDLGNLIGRTAHRGGTSHGHDGLWYYFRDGDYQFRNILLTRDYDKALVFLGYDPVRFKAGFEDLEEIFQYVAGSKFFNREIFLLENRNAASRVRDRKRKTYAEFLQWCEARPDLPAYQYPDDKKEWHPRIVEHFPHFAGEHQAAVDDLAKARSAKEKFSGAWVTAVTGLSGKELGMLMKHVKEAHGGSAGLQTHVLQTSETDLRAEVMVLKGKLEL